MTRTEEKCRLVLSDVNKPKEFGKQVLVRDDSYFFLPVVFHGGCARDFEEVRLAKHYLRIQLFIFLYFISFIFLQVLIF